MCPWLWTNLWISLWTRAAMLPLAMIAAAPPARVRAEDLEKEEYLIEELREDLEVMGVQGIIDEGGRR